MRWFQIVIALLGGVLCEGLRVVLYVLGGMYYDWQRPYPLHNPLAVGLWLAPVVVIALLAVFLRLLGAGWRRSVGVAFVTYLGGVCTHQFTRSLGFFTSTFQNYEVQVLTLIVAGVILCIGLVVRNPTYPRWTLPVLIGTCMLGCIGAIRAIATVYSGSWQWLYQATYIVPCTVYGLILVLAWRKPVEDTLGKGVYTLGSKGDQGTGNADDADLKGLERMGFKD